MGYLEERRVETSCRVDRLVGQGAGTVWLYLPFLLSFLVASWYIPFPREVCYSTIGTGFLRLVNTRRIMLIVKRVTGQSLRLIAFLFVG
jgi:hypothetical protein